MPVDRPTFSESWYRVANQRPRLRSTVQTYRQQYRGQMWHVVRDPANNQFFRLNDAAYHFVGLLDGRRSVAQVWETCNEQLGDQAPTQNEAIQLLGQLYTSNLLHGELPSDAEGMFERYKKRVNREVRGYMMNLLFVRVPLIDPEHFLNRWLQVFGWVFSWFGFVLWAGILCAGGYFLIGRVGELWHQVNYVLNPDNLLFLYLSFGLIKAIHEFGHGFACKKFGRQSGSGGEVHTMGIMFLVFMPVPYVDASSAWALRSKWQRIMISAAGMYVELAVAAIAAIVWANTREGTLTNVICYNVMFIASVSTLLFNGNPLLRFDGYYILSDLLEIPNLSQRGKDYLYYLVKKFVYGVRRARTTAQSAAEKRWLIAYAIASSIYRVFISVRILMFVADKLFFVGAIMAVVALVGWVFVPLGKWGKYLATSTELVRTRPRAVISTFVFFALIVGGLGAIWLPDYERADGFVEPMELANIHAGAEGFVVEASRSAQLIRAGDPLVVTENLELEAQLAAAEADRKILRRRLSIARTSEPAEFQAIKSQISARDAEISELNRQIGRLRIEAPIAGVWVAPQIDQLRGAFVRLGDFIGRIAETEHVIVRALADQTVGPRIDKKRYPRVEIRIKGRPDLYFMGTIVKVLPAGFERLPTPSMGYAAEGRLAVDPSDPEGTKTTERFFEVQIKPDTWQTNHGPKRAGGRAAVSVVVANTAGSALQGPAAIEVRLSADDVADDSDALIGTLVVSMIDLEPGQSKAFTVEATFPDMLEPGPHHLVARIGPAESQDTPAPAIDAVAHAAAGAGDLFAGITIAVEQAKELTPLLPGQRVVARFQTGRWPLAYQWWLTIRQLVQRRFQI